MHTYLLCHPFLLFKRTNPYIKTFFICCLTLFIMPSLFASFYEVNVKMSWKNIPLRTVNAYLVRDTSEKATDPSFTKEYAALTEKQTALNKIADRNEKIQLEKEIKKAFRVLVKKYSARRVSVQKKGEMCLNVDPGENYYLVVIKKHNLLKINPNLLFWVKNIKFEYGAIEAPQEILFNENNVILW